MLEGLIEIFKNIKFVKLLPNEIRLPQRGQFLLIHRILVSDSMGEILYMTF